MKKITVLQDHSAFMQRMWDCSLESYDALPLGVPAIDAIRRALIVVKFRGRLIQLGEANALADTLNPGAELEALAKAMATAVEGDVEAWYCIADDEGAKALEDCYCGTVLRWNGATWWAKLKGVQVSPDLERVFHEAYRKPRKSPRSRAAHPPSAEAAGGGPAGLGSPTGIRRGDVRPIG